ncbi:MAG: M48 family metallopeptidase [Ignavibacteriaceae bacterium]|nr:M48 family metallopeptidase [Ignavibacteriaceae bacterium]
MSTHHITHFTLDGKELPCRIRRSSRAKYISLRITPAGELELILPGKVKPEDGLRLLEKNKEWVRARKKLLKSDADEYFYLGKKLTVVRSFSEDVSDHEIRLRGDQFLIKSPVSSRMSVQSIYDGFIRHRAERHLLQRAEQLAQMNSFEVENFSLRKQKSRWGSCSSGKRISLNVNLMKCPENIIDYVIFHELCHLRYMDHSEKFWNEVRKYVPDYRKLRRQLKFYAKVN